MKKTMILLFAVSCLFFLSGTKVRTMLAAGEDLLELKRTIAGTEGQMNELAAGLRSDAEAKQQELEDKVAKRRKYLEENALAASIRLTDDELARIDEVMPRGAAAGERYGELGMSLADL